jgi:hypothetical protein
MLKRYCEGEGELSVSSTGILRTVSQEEYLLKVSANKPALSDRGASHCAIKNN